MGSSGKRKTTMAKLDGERRLRARRLEKQVKKNLRKRAAAEEPDRTGGASSGAEAPGPGTP